ncbi:DEAD-box ATP-dependent RNA helicase 53-like [Gossypium australe]|uniref:DEAD-box ATP-dependent RNA helicase 53-like n=1 Tax=Gossypium australe TaxID=47621 RepID=A0A5B6V5V2_9ROSI|nr:DEAD-box ATP-dependent RNA helicase 53-like [Gossypium australe]
MVSIGATGGKKAAISVTAFSGKQIEKQGFFVLVRDKFVGRKERIYNPNRYPLPSLKQRQERACNGLAPPGK